MEEEILQEMIRDRDSQLVMIRKKMEEQEKKMETTRKQLEEVKKEYSSSHLEHQLEVDSLVQHHSKLLSQYKEAKEALDMKKQQQGPQLHVYNEIMKSLTEPTENQDSSYVTRMQAQLCKAMHSMGMVETQLAMANTQAEGVQRYLKESKTSVVEEKTHVELKLMNDLVGTDNERKEVAEKVQKQAEDFHKEKDSLLEKIEQQQEQEEEPEENAEEDEEEKAELMEILQEGRDEIARMEKENKVELEKLEALKQKAIATKGEKFVEELCAQIEEEFKEKLQGSDGEEEEEEEED